MLCKLLVGVIFHLLPRTHFFVLWLWQMRKRLWTFKFLLGTQGLSTLAPPPTLLQLEWEWSALGSHFWMLGPQRVALFWKVGKLRRWSPAEEVGQVGADPRLDPSPCCPSLLSEFRNIVAVASGHCRGHSTPWWPAAFQTVNQNKCFHWVLSCQESQQHGMLTLHTLSREQRKTPSMRKSAKDKRHEDHRPGE